MEEWLITKNGWKYFYLILFIAYCTISQEKVY